MKTCHFFILFLSALVIAGCNTFDKPTGVEEGKPVETSRDFAHVDVPEGFGYENYTHVELLLEFRDTYDRLLTHQLFQLFTEEGDLILTGKTNEFGKFHKELSLSRTTNTIICRAHRIGLPNDEWRLAVTRPLMSVTIK